MNIGREITHQKGRFYSVQYFFKDKGEIQRCSALRTGKMFQTNIDCKGRIYIPRDISGVDILSERHFAYFYGILSVSAFRFISYLHPTLEDNARIMNEIAAGNEPFELTDPWTPAIERSIDRIDTKVAIRLSAPESGESPGLFNSNNLQIRFDYDSILTTMRFTQKKKDAQNSIIKKMMAEKKRRGFEIIHFVNSWKDGTFGEEADKKDRRYRLPLPNRFLEFAEIVPESDQIILLSLQDEIEIWKASLWKELVNKRVWLSEVGKYIFINGDEKEEIINAKNNPIIKDVLSGGRRSDAKFSRE